MSSFDYCSKCGKLLNMYDPKHDCVYAPRVFEELAFKWEKDLETHPNHEIGEYCQAVLRCCIRELNDVIREYNTSKQSITEEDDEKI